MSEGSVERSTGDIVDALGADLELDDGDLPEAVIILAKVINEDGKVQLLQAASPGLSWLEHEGMLSRAASMLEDDDDD